jgi:ATP-binding cassette, subfamily B, bacterial
LVVGVPGVDIKSLDPQWLRRNIGVVSQEPILFATSIEDNIRYAKPDATDAEVESAARIANAHGFISSFPQGYRTLVCRVAPPLQFYGHDASLLSLTSGWRTRCPAVWRSEATHCNCSACAEGGVVVCTPGPFSRSQGWLQYVWVIVQDPPVVLLDEATSALDAESEFAVQDALNRAMSGRTVLSIAHRISTVRASDEIAVLQDGKVVEQEPFEDLLSKSGSAFNELMQRQLN